MLRSRVSVGVGTPLAVTVNLPALPTTNVAVLALVIAGGVCVALIVNVKFWFTGVPTPLLAVMVIG